MSTNDEILKRFAILLGDESYQEYHSCFGKVMKILQSELKIAEGIEAGSLAMGFKIKDSGDLDVIFTYKETKKSTPTIRQDLHSALETGLENQANVTLNDPNTSRAVKVVFDNELEMDIVYKDFASYEREKNMIDHFNNLPDEILHIIQLVKYAEENYTNCNLQKRKIHGTASTAQGGSFGAKLRYTIHRCGGGGQVNAICEYLIQEARNKGIN